MNEGVPVERARRQGAITLVRDAFDDGEAKQMLGRYERDPTGEAKVEYGDGTMRVVRPGRFVRCAVTDEAIPLDALRYWSVERQEAYASPEAVMERLKSSGQAG